MTETRDFPTAVTASLSTGILLYKFGDMHEAAEYLMGHPIWTHHFADKMLTSEMKRAIAEQCPGMPIESKAIVRTITSKKSPKSKPSSAKRSESGRVAG
jgi:hypothetical protein